MNKEKTKVFYKDFGAVGDGVTDDFDALRTAHLHANEMNGAVYAEAGAKYYIGNHGKEFITVKTDTFWDGAEIIIDDTVVKWSDEARVTPVFKILSDYETVRHGADSDAVKGILSVGGIKRDSEKLGYAPGYPVLLIPYDESHKVYIRYGGNADSGESKHEVFVIDANGNIDPDTRPLFDYGNLSYVLEKRIDDEPITLSGGTFITLANRSRCNYDYYERNMHIMRSNVTVRGLTHKIVGEGDTGAPYDGFFNFMMLNDLMISDTALQAHRYYVDEREHDEAGNVTVWGTCMGTYDIAGSSANKICFKNCTESNFYSPNGTPTSLFYDENGNTALDNQGNRAGVWGIMGSNNCKNITYDSCTLSRLDAHAGVYNASIVNSVVSDISLIGGGTALIRDSKIYCSGLVRLRGDYGSTWEGEIVIEGCEWYTDAERPAMVSGVYSNHDFGYVTYIPSVTVDGLTVHTDSDTVYVFSDFHADGKDIFAEQITEGGVCVANNNRMMPPKHITVKDNLITNKKILLAYPDSVIAKKIEDRR